MMACPATWASSDDAEEKKRLLAAIFDTVVADADSNPPSAAAGRSEPRLVHASTTADGGHGQLHAGLHVRRPEHGVADGQQSSPPTIPAMSDRARRGEASGDLIFEFNVGKVETSREESK